MIPVHLKSNKSETYLSWAILAFVSLVLLISHAQYWFIIFSAVLLVVVACRYSMINKGLLLQANGQWQVCIAGKPSPAFLEPSSVIAFPLSFLHFKLLNGKKIAFVVSGLDIAKEDFRRLRVFARWGASL
jgi:hypothetical protein